MQIALHYARQNTFLAALAILVRISGPWDASYGNFPLILRFGLADGLYLQLFELLTGEALFDPQFQTVELGLSSDESHLIQMIELFGTFPLNMVLSGRYSQRWFTQEGKGSTELRTFHCHDAKQIIHR